jgi:tRNA dimethylallyltransferase
VFAATGRPLTAWQETGAPAVTDFTAVALEPPRDVLYARCDARLLPMVKAGALAEVQAFLARDLDPALPAMKAVGVREFAAHLAGQTSLETAISAAQQETRRYAKRQLTWMRGRMANWRRIAEAEQASQLVRLLSICS